MKVSQEIIEQIDSYLEGNLSKEALRSFNERLNRDSSFKTLVEQQALLIRSIKKKELLAVKKKLNSFHEEMISQKTTIGEESKSEAIIRPLNSRSTKLTWLATAAAILFLVLGYFNYTDNSVNQTAEELVGTSRKYIKIPVINRASIKTKEIQLLIVPSLEKDIKYILTREEINLRVPNNLISKIEKSLYNDIETPNIFYIKIADNYYELVETTTPKIAKIASYSRE